MKQNPNFHKVEKRYLFQQISQKVQAFKAKNPNARLLSLGIGDTTEPIGPHASAAMTKACQSLARRETYVGYGPEQGIPELRVKISHTIYQGKIAADDIFVSDGAKCDLGRLQILFGQDTICALQDPTYPVYLDTGLIVRGGKMITLPCLAENNFMPDLSAAIDADVLFLCFPNNPTGTMCSHAELAKIVSFAKTHGLIIVYDAAYSFYVQKGPKSIYEIPGADEVAIELGSFSKIAGFSGVRLGWTVVPEALCYKNGPQIKPDWSRISSTFFNGASILSQKGGIAVLDTEGLQEVHSQVSHYLGNIGIIKRTLEEAGIEVHGAVESPYAWVRLSNMSSWQIFDLLLEEAHIVTTPGVGFGPSGEGFVRISGFAARHTIEEAACRLKEVLRCSFH